MRTMWGEYIYCIKKPTKCSLLHQDKPNVMKVSETMKAWCIHSIFNTYRQHEC